MWKREIISGGVEWEGNDSYKIVFGVIIYRKF